MTLRFDLCTLNSKESVHLYTDRIRVGIVTESAKLTEVATQFADYIRGETLAVELTIGMLVGIEPVTLRADGDEL